MMLSRNLHRVSAACRSGRDWGEVSRRGVAASAAPPHVPIDALVKAEHNHVRHLFDKFRAATEPEQKQQLAYTIIRELSMHSSKEEEVLYPAIASAFGSAERDHLLKSHTVLKSRMCDVAATAPEAPDFDSKMEGVFREFDCHSVEEERRELPRLINLGHAYVEAGKHAVTRPHSWAPDKPPMAWFVHRLAAPLDKVADAVRFGLMPHAEE